MPQDNEWLIQQTADYVRQQLAMAEAGHDWWHIQRVWNNVKLILQREPADGLTCELAALLHDIADSKFHGGDEALGPRIAGKFLRSLHVSEDIVQHVQAIIANMSYKASLGHVAFHSKELEIVQDADRLDAMGAIGIARAFHYGGFKNRELYNPEIAPNIDQDKETYKNSTAPTINHFYEKLLLLKEKMNTTIAKHIAKERHAFMEQYLAQFYKEWEGR
ncbi:HD domain-containing protein [Parapedobacter deserti]|uniref:HD domain-containing protein n=1 Tax=Parapedobacter deserti TaxID=1912957 RepID=A0ABV7JSS3_9SPHI